MTYQSYSRGIRLIFAVLGPLFLLQQFGKVLFEEQRLILAFLYFAVRIATLYLLFFSIYAFLSKIRSIHRLESPVIFIIIAVVFVVLSFGPPIVFYVLSRDTGSVYSRLDVSEVKSNAMNINVSPVERLQSVRNYYLDTGTRLPYLDDNNKETILTPDDMAVKLYDMTTKLKLTKTNLKITALGLIGVFFVSVICFSIFLWYRFPQQTHKQV